MKRINESASSATLKEPERKFKIVERNGKIYVAVNGAIKQPQLYQYFK